MKRLSAAILVLFGFLLAGSAPAQEVKPVYLDPSQPVAGAWTTSSHG